MSAFLAALGKYKAGNPEAPAVNAPEAPKVLEKETAPEVANVRAPVESPTSSTAGAAAPGSETAPPESAPKTRTRRSRASTASAAVEDSAAGAEPTLAQAIELVAMQLPSSCTLTIVGRG